jgi:hypothetical protein
MRKTTKKGTAAKPTRKAAKAKPAPVAAEAEPVVAAKPEKTGRRGQILALLRRNEGATIADICKATGWLNHTARAFISATIGKKLGHTLSKEKDAERGLIYRVASA